MGLVGVFPYISGIHRAQGESEENVLSEGRTNVNYFLYCFQDNHPSVDTVWALCVTLRLSLVAAIGYAKHSICHSLLLSVLFR